MYFTRINSRPPVIEKVIALTCFMVPLMILGADFSKILSQRTGRIIWHHTALSFSLAENNYYKKFNEYVLSDTAKQFYADIQNSVEEKSIILAWVSTPIHLDYTRNKIFSIADASGLTSPWLNLPLGANPQKMTAFLLNKKIKYILWEYKGYSMRNRQGYQRLAASSYVGRKVVGQHGLYVIEILDKIVDDATILYQNDRIVLCELEKQE